MDTPDLQRLADRVQTRRLELNLSARRAAQVAGMSKDTWARVEAGLSVQAATYDKIESALFWTVGSCRKIMDGGDAVVLDDDSDDFTIAPVPPEALADEISQAVQVAMVGGTDLNPSKIREVNERALEILRARGILPPSSN